MDFYEKLTEICQRKGITLTKLAKDVGLSSSNITYWKENGRVPRNDVIKRISDYLNISTDYFHGSSLSIENVHDNHGFIGTNNASVNIGVNLGEIETEILRIMQQMTTKQKNALLAKAYELQEEK